MSEDKPTPLQDVRKGLGLLFRAARTAVEKLPKGAVEEVVVTSAREVGRAIENVATAIEREVFGKKSGTSRQEPSDGEPRQSQPPDEEKAVGGDEPKPPDSAA